MPKFETGEIPYQEYSPSIRYFALSGGSSIQEIKGCSHRTSVTPIMKLDLNTLEKSRFDVDIVKAYRLDDQDSFLAKAAVENLRPLLPSDVDLDKNYDLLGVAFNAFVVNRGNKNGQMTAREDILPFIKDFIHKPFNLNHDRFNVVGFCTGYGFSEFGTDKLLTYEDVKDMDAPFNVVLSGFVWWGVAPDFCEDLLESSDPSSPRYLKISASWEVGFINYGIARGDKDYAKCEILHDEAYVTKNKGNLRHFGGKGSDETGTPLYLCIKAPIFPLGIGFTEIPAAEVKGIINTTSHSPLEDENGEASNEQNEPDEPETQEIISQTVQVPVTTISYMKITKPEDITGEFLKACVAHEEVYANEIRSFLEQQISEFSKKYVAAEKEKETATTKFGEDLQALKDELDKVKKENEAAAAELEGLKKVAAQKAQEEAFSARMTKVDEVFQFSDEEKSLFANEIKDLDEKGFEAWVTKYSVIAKSKTKSFIQEEEAKAKEVSKREAALKAAAEKAGLKPEEVFASALDNATPEEPEIPNSQSQAELSIAERMKKAFANV